MRGSGGTRLGRCVLLWAAGISGCQCCILTDPYADVIDCIATNEIRFDALYHPGLDLTRIGRSDWCQCRINRALCPCACARLKPLPHIGEPPLTISRIPPARTRPVRQPLLDDSDFPELPESLDADPVDPSLLLLPPSPPEPQSPLPSEPAPVPEDPQPSPSAD